jgi:hypothetical protein
MPDSECRFQFIRRPNHFRRDFFQFNRDWNRVFQLNRRLFAAPFPNAENADFSFKSATKFGPQMVYELNEVHDLTEKTLFN